MEGKFPFMVFTRCSTVIPIYHPMQPRRQDVTMLRSRASIQTPEDMRQPPQHSVQFLRHTVWIPNRNLVSLQASEPLAGSGVGEDTGVLRDRFRAAGPVPRRFAGSRTCVTLSL